MGHAAPKRIAPKPAKLLTRAEHAVALFVADEINLDEFERRIDVLMNAGKEDDPYIIDAGPAGFREP